MSSDEEKQFSNDYLILKADSASLVDLFLFLLPFNIISIKNLADVPEGKEDSYTTFGDRWVIATSILLQKLITAIANFFNFSNFLSTFFTKRGRVMEVAHKTKTTEVNCKDWRIVGSDNDMQYYGSLTMMASALAYQNPSVVDSVVNNCWKMKLLECYSEFWNDFQNEATTHAFTFQNTASDPNVTVVAFRGTASFDDMKEDIDYSWYDIEGIGQMHDGFMEALGLQKVTGWPKDLPPNPDNHQFAYYTLRQALIDISNANDNAKFVFTGHSLGGALAILFVTILAYHGESDLLKKLQAVYTFGQPRVGNSEFAQFMENTVKIYGFKYYRYVYSFDIVPRVPFDITKSSYKHFGGCVYFTCCYKGKFLETQPDRNYILQFWLIPCMYGIAVWELLRSIIIPIFKGLDYFEGFYSLIIRVVGLLIPGLSAHICPNYINSTRYGKIQTSKDIETKLLAETVSNQTTRNMEKIMKLSRV